MSHPLPAVTKGDTARPPPSGIIIDKTTDAPNKPTRKEKVKREEEKARREKEEKARKEREENLKREKEEKMRREKEERMRREKEEKEEKLRREKEEKSMREREEKVKREREEQARREREEQERREREEKVRREREEKAKREREKAAAKKEKEKVATKKGKAPAAPRAVEAQNSNSRNSDDGPTEDMPNPPLSVAPTSDRAKTQSPPQHHLADNASVVPSSSGSSDRRHMEPPSGTLADLKKHRAQKLADMMRAKDINLPSMAEHPEQNHYAPPSPMPENEKQTDSAETNRNRAQNGHKNSARSSNSTHTNTRGGYSNSERRKYSSTSEVIGSQQEANSCCVIL